MAAGKKSKTKDAIVIQGAREHNLKDVSLSVPLGKFVVVTGVSGSGKSTLAFDLIFNEGQRRFLDSMSAYARQFVEQMARPDVDLIAGIPPTVSIEQSTSRGGGKSTVATVTEIHHFIRLLYARLGTPFCPDCEVPVEPQTRGEVISTLRRQAGKGGTLRLLAPVIRNRKGFHSAIATWARKHCYEELRADGEFYSSDQPFRLDRFKEHDIEVVIGDWSPRNGDAGLAEMVEAALEVGKGVLFAMDARGELTVHSTERACGSCGKSFAKLDPKNFSYNSSQGWCPNCRGFGETFYLPEVERGARADAIEESWYMWQEGQRELCKDCGGARLNPLARAVRLRLDGTAAGLGDPTIDFFSQASVAEAHACFAGYKLAGAAEVVARDVLPEITERLRFLCEVGLDYLQLGRGVPTLSGGEAQRIRLAAQLGSNLSGVLYVLDEPTIGLHARDNEQLLNTLEKLRGRGNSLLVVEHDEDTMRRADHILDLGPGAGVNGGELVASGTLAELMRNPSSVTGAQLKADRRIPARGHRRKVGKAPSRSAGEDWLILKGADRNNLCSVNARIPLGRFVTVTGVSGSGKSTLVRECLLPAVQAGVDRKSANPVNLLGAESLSAVYEVDQAPIGRTPRSTPATYVGFFDEIRKLFAQTPEARLRGYGPGRFSFNSPQGRCPECAGAGQIKIEMNFLPAAHVRCETCAGLRFNPETLDVLFNGRNISQVLDLSVEQAVEFFGSFQKIRRPLEALCDTGLEYLKLGQPSPTLSGGEAQRVKLVSHLLGGLKDPKLANMRAKRNLFILEEPTIGLHISDVRRLVEVIQRLVDFGHSVVVIEHNLDLIAESDWVLDLGPEGGGGGGRIVGEGTPEAIARLEGSHTGRYLRQVLSGR
ncbi:MAG: excinuclease ABC subunit A [Verrucomicrobiae bacterium]|nr:excinuclease ABC subunit A [Verrucomicrobiae bacterium]